MSEAALLVPRRPPFTTLLRSGLLPIALLACTPARPILSVPAGTGGDADAPEEVGSAPTVTVRGPSPRGHRDHDPGVGLV